MRECSHQNYLLIASYLLHKLDALSLKRVGEVGPAYILCISLLLVKRVRPHGKDPENGKPSQWITGIRRFAQPVGNTSK